MYLKRKLKVLVIYLKKKLTRIRLKYDQLAKLIITKKYCLPFEKECVAKYTIKQISLILFYKSKEYLVSKIIFLGKKVSQIFNSTITYLFLFFITLFLLKRLNLNIPVNEIKTLSHIFSGIIGASIAIIFSFSLFSLQNSADMFSNQYLNRFIEDKKEKLFFWILVVIAILILLLPYVLNKYLLEAFILLFVTSFYLIFILFRDLKKRSNPEATLKKIKDESISLINKYKNRFQKQSNIISKIHEYEDDKLEMNLDIQYKINRNWNYPIKQNVKQLYEIGLRLLSKNEIHSANMSIKYIRDIYIEYLKSRNGSFIKFPVGFMGTFSHDDEDFSNIILEHLESISDRLLQEKRKENIYYLLKIYENILINSLDINYVKNISHNESNPLANLVLEYHARFSEKIVNSDNGDWVWNNIQLLSAVSNKMAHINSDFFLTQKIYSILNIITFWSINNKKATHLSMLVNIYFQRINISWVKDTSLVRWDDLLKELKKGIIALSSVEDRFSMALSNIFINFNSWKRNLLSNIANLEDLNRRKKEISNFIQSLGKWSEFLLDFTRGTGLNNKQTGLSIIQSVEDNLSNIRHIKRLFPEEDMERLYNEQFSILSLYFNNEEVIEESFLPNFEIVIETFLREIVYNFNNNTFNNKRIIGEYCKLIDYHFENISVGYGYNHPRVIKKLIYLGLLLSKYDDDQEMFVISKIKELNNKYILINERMYPEGNTTGPDKFHLCKEIFDLENDLFPHGNSLRGILYFLSQEISKEHWDNFLQKISFCNDIEYTKSDFMF